MAKSKKKAPKKKAPKKKAPKKKAPKKKARRRSRVKRPKVCRTLMVRAGDLMPAMRLASSGEAIKRLQTHGERKRGRTVAVTLVVTEAGNAYALPSSRKVAVVSC